MRIHVLFFLVLHSKTYTWLFYSAAPLFLFLLLFFLLLLLFYLDKGLFQDQRSSLIAEVAWASIHSKFLSPFLYSTVPTSCHPAV